MFFGRMNESASLPRGRHHPSRVKAHRATRPARSRACGLARLTSTTVRLQSVAAPHHPRHALRSHGSLRVVESRRGSTAAWSTGPASSSRRRAPPPDRCRSAATAAKRRVRSSEGSGFSLRARHRCSGQTLGHARLPTGAGGSPACDNFGWQAQADQLTWIHRARAAALLDDCTSEHFVGEFREFLVLRRLDDVRVNARQVRAQSTARGGFAHDRWPFAC